MIDYTQTQDTLQALQSMFPLLAKEVIKLTSKLFNREELIVNHLKKTLTNEKDNK